MSGDYERLLELSRLQAELVASGRVPESTIVAAEWQALAATLPPNAPEEARRLLEEAGALTAASADSIAAQASAIAREAELLERGRRAFDGYARAQVA
jgi:hypothetical protein